MSDYRTGGHQTTTYQQRVNAERVARQAPDVKKTVKEILETIKSIEQYIYWSIDPEEHDILHWTTNLIDHAHALVDLGHEYRAALKANPPPKEEEDADGEDDAA